MWQRTKRIAIALLAVLVLVVVAQNTEAVETRLLFTTVTMPRAALLFGTLLIGFLLGLACALRMSRSPRGD